MKHVKVLRLVSVLILLVLFLFLSLYLLIPRSGDGSKGVLAVCFIDEDRLFPEMDYRQMFSSLDMTAEYSVGEDLSVEQMQPKILAARSEAGAQKVVLVCDGSYAVRGLQLASAMQEIDTLVLMSPDFSDTDDLSAFGTREPNKHVAIFTTESKQSDLLYERLSGEDTSFTPGIMGDKRGLALRISPDSTRYYANYSGFFKASSHVAGTVTLNDPVVQSYFANYLKNYCLNESGTSSTMILIWTVKVLSTALLLVAFFLYAATIPKGKGYAASSNEDEHSGENAQVSKDAHGRAKLKNRSVTAKFISSMKHLMALQILLGLCFAAGGCVFVWKTPAHVKHVMLIWMWMSFVSSAFFLLKWIRKLPAKTVRKSRSLLPIHIMFIVGILLDLFLLSLLWTGSGSLSFGLITLIAVMLAVMVAVAIFMLDKTDTFYLKMQGRGNGVLDSVIFSAIRFVPMVIVFIFSIIMNIDICALQVILLAVGLLLAAMLRRIIKRGASGDVLSVIFYAGLYWMMF